MSWRWKKLPLKLWTMPQLEIRTETGQDGHHLSHVLSSVSVYSLWCMLPKTVTFQRPFLNNLFVFLIPCWRRAADKNELAEDFILAPWVLRFSATWHWIHWRWISLILQCKHLFTLVWAFSCRYLQKSWDFWVPIWVKSMQRMLGLP